MPPQERGTPMVEYPNTLNAQQAAKYVGISEAALRLWRSEGTGPRYFKAGLKLIRYRRVDLDQWIEARLVKAEQYGPLELKQWIQFLLDLSEMVRRYIALAPALADVIAISRTCWSFWNCWWRIHG